MMNAFLALFQGSSLVPAIVLAAVSFLLGGAAVCGVCRLRHRACACGKGDACCRKDKKAGRRDEVRFEKAKYQPPADGSVEIYVGNLSYDLTEAQLREAFEKFGKVNSARIVTNRSSNRSKGFGFVQMPNRPEAEAAIDALSEKELLGRKLKCNEAKSGMC